MRDIDNPALALDLGDGLGEREPVRDLLGDEEADDLALAGRLDLLSDDDLDVAVRRTIGCGTTRARSVLLGERARSERAGDLVVVGDGDRSEALRARGREQHLD